MVDNILEVVLYLLLGLMAIPFFVRVLVFSYGKAVKEFKRRHEDE